MTKSVLRSMLLLVALALFAAACGGDDGDIEVEDVTYRVSRSDLGAGYMQITNTTGDSVTLVGASAAGVERIELHESVADDEGTMSMQARPDGFVIGDGETITLQPGGMHLMLFGPEGTDDLDLVLDFGSETVSVVAAYDELGSAGAMDHGDHEDDAMDHGDDDAMDHGGDAMDDDDAMADS